MVSKRVMVTFVWLATGLVWAAETSALRNVKPGERIPEFSVTELSGKTITKSDYAGRVLVLLFARPEHAKSLSALHAVQRLHNANRQGGPAVLVVATKPGKGKVFAALARQWGFEFSIALDPKRELYGALGLVVAPTTLVIDPSGVLRYELAHFPPSYERTLQLHVDHLLGRIAGSEHDALMARKPSGAGRYPGDARNQRLALARALIEEKEVSAALAILQKLHEEQKDEAAAALFGATLLGDGRVDQAQQVLKLYAERHTRSGAMNLALGQLALAQGQESDAERFLEAAAGVDDERAQALYLLGGLHERREDPRALSCYRQALEHIFDEFIKTPKN